MILGQFCTLGVAKPFVYCGILWYFLWLASVREKRIVITQPLTRQQLDHPVSQAPVKNSSLSNQTFGKLVSKVTSDPGSSSGFVSGRLCQCFVLLLHNPPSLPPSSVRPHWLLRPPAVAVAVSGRQLRGLKPPKPKPQQQQQWLCRPGELASKTIPGCDA